MFFTHTASGSWNDWRPQCWLTRWDTEQRWSGAQPSRWTGEGFWNKKGLIVKNWGWGWRKTCQIFWFSFVLFWFVQSFSKTEETNESWTLHKQYLITPGKLTLNVILIKFIFLFWNTIHYADKKDCLVRIIIFKGESGGCSSGSQEQFRSCILQSEQTMGNHLKCLVF